MLSLLFTNHSDVKVTDIYPHLRIEDLAKFFSNHKTLLYFNLISALGIIILGITKLI